MRKNIGRMFCWIVAATMACQAQRVISPDPPSASKYSQLPLTFEANQGQTDSTVKFLSRGTGYTAFLTSGGLVLSLRAAESSPTQRTSGIHAANQPPSPPVTLQFALVGATRSSIVRGEDPQPGRVNYFIGNDPDRWHTNVPTYARIRSKDVYPGIDLVYYGNQRQLEYDFELSPGADPNAIQFAIGGALQIRIDSDGDLVLETRSGELHFKSPAIYQESNGQRTPVGGRYVLRDSTHVGFQVSRYREDKPLVIDPVLVYATYLGGSGNDVAQGIAVDANGNVYIAGYTDSADFPLASLGSMTPGVNHAFVVKLDANGSNLVYADYLGGNGQDYGFALTLDHLNDVYITGSTNSNNFPVVKPYQGTYPGGSNAFLSKISPSGSSLMYSTYLGGNSVDTPSSVALDFEGNIVVGGTTQSTNFPVANAFQSTVSPNQGGLYGPYGFLTKFNPDGSSLIYSTYFGGNSNVALNCGGTPCWPQPDNSVTGVALDSAGNAYATGSTNTYNFPVTAGAYLTTDSIQFNIPVGFVIKFSGSGSLQYSSYFYESSGAMNGIYAIAADDSGSAYITGAAASDGTFPITATSICDPAVYGFGCSSGFVTKFDPTGSTLSYSTFLGPNNYFGPTSIVLDANGDAYVSGSSTGSSFGTVNGIEPYTGGSDVLLTEIDPVGGSELWASYLGGSQDDFVTGMALDSSGSLYVAGITDSTDFPTTQSTFQRGLAGGTDTFVVKIAPSSAPSVSVAPAVLTFPLQVVNSSSSPQTVILRNMGSASLAITSISHVGDFAETDDCGTAVSAAGSCTLVVTFTPTALGHRIGSIAVSDDAAKSPHVITLTGDASTGAGVSLSASTLLFPPQQVGGSSTAQSVSLTSNGVAPLHIGSIAASGDYVQTNNCPATLSSGSACTINVSFTPKGPGTRSGTLVVNDDANASPQTAQLNGTGLDFSLTATPNSNAVQRGSATQYELIVSAAGGPFVNTVQLTCGMLPPNTTCSVSPNTGIPGSSQWLTTLTVTTTSATTGSLPSKGSHGSFMYALLMQLPVFGLCLVSLTRRRNHANAHRSAVLAAVIASLMIMTACAGGTGIVPQSGGTPPGTYTITVSGASGSLQHSLPLILIVK